jgi:hypothetical protein
MTVNRTILKTLSLLGQNGPGATTKPFRHFALQHGAADYTSVAHCSDCLACRDLDSSIGKTLTISFVLQQEYGQPAPREKMRVLGTDVVLTLADLRDAITGHFPKADHRMTGD